VLQMMIHSDKQLMRASLVRNTQFPRCFSVPRVSLAHCPSPALKSNFWGFPCVIQETLLCAPPYLSFSLLTAHLTAPRIKLPCGVLYKKISRSFFVPRPFFANTHWRRCRGKRRDASHSKALSTRGFKNCRGTTGSLRGSPCVDDARRAGADA
jgi:hypothetical protein